MRDFHADIHDCVARPLSSAEAFCEKFEVRKSSRQRKTRKGGKKGRKVRKASARFLSKYGTRPGGDVLFIQLHKRLF